ncbi:SapC family protein [Alteromonas halophila]|uniref:Peptidase n=1 Tax=Alteromonas halophila TaxID=516698 RepID=A0A918JGJ1_9ALTE|nr:SapC family protein [Alteromonas halophila]GGW78132.1 peptidase [Alteromonas halophila]
MANHVLLNNVDHKALRVRDAHGPDYGDNLMCVPVFPVEARHAQAHYPLMFAKNPDGDYQLVALLGFKKDENLFIENEQWLADYRPLVVEKGPFLIGRNQQDESKLSIHIDLDDARVNENEGQAIFLPHGGNSDYIDNIANVLSTLHQSQDKHREFIARCNALSLIESFVLDIDLEDTGTHRLSGFYTINEEVLRGLNGEQMAELQQHGDLEVIYMILASMSQMRNLVKMKKARLAD